MTIDARAWSFEHPAYVADLRDAGALPGLLNTYGSANPRVLAEVLGQVYRHGAQMAVVETRYVDADYRNEHSRFYSTTFRRYPSVAHRMHFFADPPESVTVEPERSSVFGNLKYLGYSVMRPVGGAPVGRTVIPAPDSLAPYVSCHCSDGVNLFGSPLRIKGTPFAAQDAQLGVCAHTTVWTTAYYHHRALHSQRVLPGDVADAVPAELGLGRPTPSTGLTVNQISEAYRGIGLPALVYRIPNLPGRETVFSVACRYLNSGLPLTVAGGGHAFVLVGYRRVRTPDGDLRIEFIRQDDEVGPYQVAVNPFLDDYSPWEWLIVPLPSKVYLAGEKAEVLGKEQLQMSLEESEDETVRSLASSDDLTFQSVVMLSNDFKTRLVKAGYPEAVAAIYQRLQMSRWIWVVEAVLRPERNDGEPCVVAEAIIDATDHLRDLHVLAWRIPGRLWTWSPDVDTTTSSEIEEMDLVASTARLSLKVHA